MFFSLKIKILRRQISLLSASFNIANSVVFVFPSVLSLFCARQRICARQRMGKHKESNGGWGWMTRANSNFDWGQGLEIKPQAKHKAAKLFCS